MKKYSRYFAFFLGNRLRRIFFNNHRHSNREEGGWINIRVWMDGWMDGWMDRWIDRWMEEWMYAYVSVFV